MTLHPLVGGRDKFPWEAHTLYEPSPIRRSAPRTRIAIFWLIALIAIGMGLAAVTEGWVHYV